MSSGPGKDMPRYLPRRAFPAYAFHPGVHPHPTRDPAGHSYAGEARSPGGAHPAWHSELAWDEQEEYLWGVDLYNHGYLWEAHEAWEGIWQACKHEDERLANFLQGLIQCSAAALKIPMQQPRGLERLAQLGTGRLEQVAQETGGLFWGLELEDFVEGFRDFAAQTAPDVDARPRLVLLPR